MKICICTKPKVFRLGMWKCENEACMESRRTPFNFSRAAENDRNWRPRSGSLIAVNTGSRTLVHTTSYR